MAASNSAAVLPCFAAGAIDEGKRAGRLGS